MKLVVQTALLVLLALVASAAAQDILPPSGTCTTPKTKANCQAYTLCEWFNSKCRFKPTNAPTFPQPTASPTTPAPTRSPTLSPTPEPTPRPTTARPTKRPTSSPTRKPTKATKPPTKTPTRKPTTPKPTKKPTLSPTKKPTKAPTQYPTKRPTKSPTKRPTLAPTVYCGFPEDGTRCEQLALRGQCIRYNGCLWTARKKCVRRAAVCGEYPTSSPSQAPIVTPPCDVPIKGCTELAQARCKNFSGCNWDSISQKCSFAECYTLAPSRAPSHSPTRTRTNAPTSSPTVAPSRSPTVEVRYPTHSPTPQPSASPTTMGPTASPTYHPTFAFTRAPTSFTVRPTPNPTGRAIGAKLVCSMPEGACGSLGMSAELCAEYSGCEMRSGVCSPKDACVIDMAPYKCGLRGLTLDLAATMLPGCMRADAEKCDAQRHDIYTALNLDTECGDSGMIPCTQGGCTLRRDILEKEIDADIDNHFYVQFFVHPTLGWDNQYNRGNKRNQPFKTIEYALTRARESTADRRKIVLLGPAVYRLNSTIILTSKDSGLTIQGEDGAIISGAVEATDLKWVPHNPINGILVANLTEEVSSKLDILSAMYINNKPAIRARYPNLAHYFENKYLGATRITKWRRRNEKNTVTNRINKRIVPGNYGFFTYATGGTCTGVFEPPTGYFCNPDHEAQGGCPYDIPGGADIDGALTSTLNARSWNHKNVFLHSFHPYKWGLWTFQLAPPPTQAPTSAPTQRPSASPTNRPTKTPTKSPTVRPTNAPTRSPTITSSPTNIPTVSPTHAPTTHAPTSQPTVSPTHAPTTRAPTSQPTASPTRAPTTRMPTSQPTASPTTLQPTASPTTPQPTASPTLLNATDSPHSLVPPSNLSEYNQVYESVDQSSVTDATGDYRLWFSRGGMQEARGDCGAGGGTFFVENDLLMLDSQNEYFLDLDDPSGPKIYFMPNTTDVRNPATKIEFSWMRDIIRVEGSTTDPVRDIHIRDITFEKTYPTHMDNHEVPSGGDWSVHRGGAILYEGVEDSSIYGCHFYNLGGNGIFISKYGRDLEVRRNEFYNLGSSAILLVGDPMFDSPTPYDRVGDPNHIERVLIEENTGSELGNIVKQSSGVFLAISRSIMIRRNIFYNIARAGIIFNDGFGGNNTITENIIFNSVLETLDHGPFNVWDRQRWYQDAHLNPTLYPFTVTNNLFLGNNNGEKGIDLDDGVANYFVDNNLVAWGLQKFKGNDVVVSRNLLLPTVLGCVLMTPINLEPARMKFTGNTCIASTQIPPYFFNTGTVQQQKLCLRKNFLAQNNQFYGPKMRANFKGCGEIVNYNSWQKTHSQDADSTFTVAIPTQEAQLSLIKEKLKTMFVTSPAP